MTRNPSEPARHTGGRPRFGRRRIHALIVLLALVALPLSACGTTANVETTAPEAAPVAGMGGAVPDVQVTQEAVGDAPEAPDLTSPEAAVRSYLAWTSYAYRIGQSQVAVPTMTSYQEVRVDSYVQYNLQQSRLLDQTLASVTFGVPSAEQGRTLLPAHETWQYRYVSATEAGKVLGGPYEASYDATYTVVQDEQGAWLVDSVQATNQGLVE